jgi:hypothetical protein
MEVEAHIVIEEFGKLLRKRAVLVEDWLSALKDL